MLKNEAINQALLNELREYAYNKTGFDIELKIKPFDNKLELPDNYADKEEDIQGSIIDKYNNVVDNIGDEVLSKLDIAIGSEGAHSEISEVLKSLLKDRLVYDETCKKWYICNKYNVWIESPTGVIIISLLNQVISTLFLKRAGYYSNKSNDSTIDSCMKSMYSKRAIEALQIFKKLKSASYLKGVVLMCQAYFLNNNFYEKKLDSKNEGASDGLQESSMAQLTERPLRMFVSEST